MLIDWTFFGSWRFWCLISFFLFCDSCRSIVCVCVCVCLLLFFEFGVVWMKFLSVTNFRFFFLSERNVKYFMEIFWLSLSATRTSLVLCILNVFRSFLIKKLSDQKVILSFIWSKNFVQRLALVFTPWILRTRACELGWGPSQCFSACTCLILPSSKADRLGMVWPIVASLEWKQQQQLRGR